jgi:hypothetical protein
MRRRRRRPKARRFTDNEIRQLRRAAEEAIRRVKASQLDLFEDCSRVSPTSATEDVPNDQDRGTGGAG